MSQCELLQTMVPVTLGDRALFERYLSQYPPQISELTFTSIFCWAEVDRHLFCEYDGHLLVSFQAKDGSLHLLPPIGPEPVRIMSEEFPGFEQYSLASIHEHLAHQVERGSKWISDDASHDYVYRLPDLRSLQGKKHDGKRNFIRRFEKLGPDVRPLTKDDALSCLHIQEQWLESQKGNPSAKDESTAFMKCMQHFADLPLHGIGVFLEGRLVGFAIGEPLNKETFVEHFEKALPGYTGIYQFLLHAFVKSIPERFTYLNREQDLGIEGLRKAKESWNPEFLQRKYRLKVRSSG